MRDADALERLVADGILRREGGRTRTTPRWQAAMARAAARLKQEEAPWRDLRLPIAAALVESYPALDDDALVPLVEALLPVEESELAPALGH
ncbi:MAG: hypothetical protein H6Q88_2322 [Anaeromyxobacteraceae bacterium]|jgi:hypothetical protein|nr:hypothetical protein [Anaeromyxobacteraceae bacterium]